ncbi:MAG: fibronectin type III domain-containing protein [Phycisphaerales bacterium]|nr:fibronectin type III domain-containing protein [Phycisphaerales bacterium]
MPSLKTALVLSVLLAAAPLFAQEATPKPKLVPVTIDTLQWDGLTPFQLFDRPVKNQGLDLLLSRARVAPEEILLDPQTKVRLSGTTIFRDQYTGSEVWKLTNYPYGIISHGYSGVPAWNANGQFIALGRKFNGGLLYDQQACTTIAGGAGQWSPTEPYIHVFTGPWEGGTAVQVGDLKQKKVLRAIAPVRQFAGVSPISNDGKFACFREGTQDTATTFGIAALDGSSYTCISTVGGIVERRTPVTFGPLPAQPALNVNKAGIHQMYFSRRPDNSVLVNVHGDDPHGRLFDADGKLIAGLENLTHQAWAPDGKYVMHMKRDVVATDPVTKKQWTILQTANMIEGHTTWNSYDPNWAGMSWRSKFAGEIIRISMRDDHSVARLCGSCPTNPDTTAYSNDEFGCNSPDGTKVLFMSTMSGNVNEYLVVAANPRAPKISGQAKGAAYEITITPDPLSREAKTYRVYRTDKSGQDYKEIGHVDLPDGQSVGTIPPLAFSDPTPNPNAFYAVRMQENSGLISRYSNDISPSGKPAAHYIEPETHDFTGYMQGYDPQGAADMYYLFNPEEGRSCSVTFDIPDKNSEVFIRIAGNNVAFTANGKTFDKKSYNDWTWIPLGNISGPIKIDSQSRGFKFDRAFITPDKSQIPEGRGLDYRPNAAFAAITPSGVATKPISPFVAEITWKAVPGVRHYNLYAGNTPDFTPAQANLLYSPPAGTERVVDWGLKPGSTQYYKVLAVDYDQTNSKPSAAVELKTPAIQVHTVEVLCASAPGAKLEDGEKSVLFDKDHPLELAFSVSADGDYVIWHNFLANNERAVRFTASLDGNNLLLENTYDLTNLGGRAIHQEFIWTRFTPLWSGLGNGVFHLKAGPHTLSLKTTSTNPLHLNKLVITNDHSYVPSGHLCTF